MPDSKMTPKPPRNSRNGDAPLAPQDRAALVALIDENGIAAVAERLSLTAGAVRRAALGEPIRCPTRRLLELQLRGPQRAA